MSVRAKELGKLIKQCWVSCTAWVGPESKGVGTELMVK